MLSCFKMESKIGPLFLSATDNGLREISFEEKLTGNYQKNKIIQQAIKELEEYFDGKRKNFSVPLELNGTAFQKKVWKVVQTIPYGKTCSYKDIAEQIHHPLAARAVGNANGKNPLCIIIPCHRVIAANGSLGGYTGELKIKKALLTIERAY